MAKRGMWAGHQMTVLPLHNTGNIQTGIVTGSFYRVLSLIYYRE